MNPKRNKYETENGGFWPASVPIHRNELTEAIKFLFIMKVVRQDVPDCSMKYAIGSTLPEFRTCRSEGLCSIRPSLRLTKASTYVAEDVTRRRRRKRHRLCQGHSLRIVWNSYINKVTAAASYLTGLFRSLNAYFFSMVAGPRQCWCCWS